MKPAMAAPPRPSAEVVQLGRLELRPAERRLFLDGRELVLGSRAFSLLCALVARRERVVNKDELIDEVWPGLVVEENNLQVQVSALRKALGPQAITTLPGLGYRFTFAATGTTGADGTADAADAAQVMPSPPAPTSSRPAAAAARLLVVEDNRVTRLLLARTLELMGHAVTTADNGRTALAMLREGRCDLLLLDLELPELSGIQLLEARSGDAWLLDTPVIVTSAQDGVETVARCIELGADGYLHKPVNPVLLKAWLESSLARKALRDLQRGGAAGMKLDDAPAEPLAADMTVLAVRLRGLDSLDSGSSAAAALALMGDWCTLMFDAIREHGGAVRQCRGDSLLATFSGLSASAAAATRAAQDMAAMVEQFNTERGGRGSSGTAALTLRVGSASGYVLVGPVGSKGPLPGGVCACAGAAVDAALAQLAS